MMTPIEDEDTVFVHTSDIQLLDGKAVSLIPDWQPNIAWVGGPPLCKTRQEDKVNIVGRVAGRIRDFIYRQKHNYRVGAARFSANSFLAGLTSQYSAIYTVLSLISVTFLRGGGTFGDGLPFLLLMVISAALLAFYSISSGATSAMTLELLPLEQQGRWGGLLGLFTGLVTIPAPIIGGLIWGELGPMYVFIIPIVFDLFFRVPLLATVPETLGTEYPIQREG